MKYTVKEVYVEAVKVVGRHRRDLGDVESLAKSIDALGLIHPITITESGTLIAGQRRLEAFRLLGRETIPARVVTDLMGAVERLKVERDENTERKPMTPEELVHLGRALEALERPKARERMTAGRPYVQENIGSTAGATRDVVAGALGISASTYERAKAVVEAAEDETATPEQRALAQAALEDMNATGNVKGNYDKVKQPTRQYIRAEDLLRAEDQRKAIAKAEALLAGIARGATRITALHPDITPDEAAQWLDGLTKSRRAIGALINRLKERSNAQA